MSLCSQWQSEVEGIEAHHLPNQEFIVVAKLRMVGNRWLWSIMLGNANEAENLELVIVDYPRNFLYWKLNYKQQWSSSAFPSVPNMFVKVVKIPAIFHDSQLLAGYHWHFHAYPMILSVMQLTIVWILKTNAHTHARTLETIYTKIFQLNEIF